MKAVTEVIKSITPANDYAHDLSDYTDEAGRSALRVFRGRDLFGASDPLPMVSILEDVRELDLMEGGDTQVGQFKLLIQGFVPDDPMNPLDPAYHLAADLVTALVRAKKDTRDILGLGYRKPCVSGLRIGSPICRTADGNVSTVAFVFLPVTLTLVEDLESPFA